MRIRTLKPEWLDDEKLAACSDAARTLSVGLILMADDHGNGRAHPGFIASRVWPYAGDDVRELAASLEKAADALDELEGIGFLSRYRVKGQTYYTLTNWTKHQRIDNAGKPKVPGPLESDEEPSRRTRGELAANSRRNSAGSPLDQDQDQDQEGEGTSRVRAIAGPGPTPTPNPAGSIDPWVTEIAEAIRQTPELHEVILDAESVAQDCYTRAVNRRGGNGMAPSRPVAWSIEALARVADRVRSAKQAGTPKSPEQVVELVKAWTSNPKPPPDADESATDDEPYDPDLDRKPGPRPPDLEERRKARQEAVIAKAKAAGADPDRKPEPSPDARSELERLMADREVPAT